MEPPTIEIDEIRARMDRIDPQTAGKAEYNWLERRYHHMSSVVSELHTAQESLHAAGYAFDFVPEEDRDRCTAIRDEITPIKTEYEQLRDDLGDLFGEVADHYYGDDR